MKKILLLILTLALIKPVSASSCFLVKEKNKILKQEGDCKSRHSPCSTFKIAISLMGYNEGLLVDENNPELPFKQGYTDLVETWKQPQNPNTWMKNSCVWYSQVLTQKLGEKKFKKYVKNFDYGNEDVSGDKAKDNGLTNAWLSSSLQISPQEQIKFLNKLSENKLPVSLKAQLMTKNILFVEDLIDGWQLYGKTGSGSLLDKDGSEKPDQECGWFIGWIQKADRKIIFVHYVEDQEKANFPLGPYARKLAKERLLQII